MVNLLSRPSPELTARRLKISRSVESLGDTEDESGSLEQLPERKVQVTFDPVVKNQSGNYDAIRPENDYSKIPKTENKLQNGSDGGRADRGRRRPPPTLTTAPFFLDFQRKFVTKRKENELRRTSSRQQPRVGPMTRAKSLGQLRDSPQLQPRNGRKVGRTISTTFELEEFEPESVELLDSNPRPAAAPRKETRL